MLWRMMIWDKVDPPFGLRFCRFWGEIELEYIPDFGAGVNHWRLKRSSRPNQFLASAGIVKDQAVFLPGGRPVQRVVFYGNDGTSPIFWVDNLTSQSGTFPVSARRGQGCINTKLNDVIPVSTPAFQRTNLQWQMLERRADPPADNQLWVGIGGKFSGTLGVAGAESAHGIVWNAGTGKRCYFVTQTSKLAIGLGASTNAVLAVFVCNDPAQLVGSGNQGMDFSLALGGNWGSFIKAANNTRAGFAVFKSMSEALKRCPAAQKSAQALVRAGVPTSLDAKGIESLANLAKSLVSTSGVDSSSACFSIFDIPLESPGLEIGVSYGFQTMEYVQHF
jgi:hypothetical protein